MDVVYTDFDRIGHNLLQYNQYGHKLFNATLGYHKVLIRARYFSYYLSTISKPMPYVESVICWRFVMFTIFKTCLKMQKVEVGHGNSSK